MMGTRLDWQRIVATLLLLPHALVTILAFFNLVGDIGLIDATGMKKINIAMGFIILGGGIVTCMALARPGKFSAMGGMARVRMAAAGWNFLNGVWLAWLFLKKGSASRELGLEMALAFVTLAALLAFAMEPKKQQ